MVAFIFYTIPAMLVLLAYLMRTGSDLYNDWRGTSASPLTLGTVLLRLALALTPVVNLITCLAIALPHFFKHNLDHYIDMPVIRNRRRK